MRIIAGVYKNKKMGTPQGLETRPTSGRLREALFNICQHTIEGADFLDLFAGSGIIGIEAISRGAKSVTFVDKSRRCAGCIQRNIQELGVQNQTDVLQGDAIQWMEKLEKKERQYDVIYVDPPYGLMCRFEGKKITCSRRILEGVDKGNLLKEGGMLFIEESQEAQPEADALTTLKLRSRRRVGRSTLVQYEKRRSYLGKESSFSRNI